jgi:hypothetical protein
MDAHGSYSLHPRRSQCTNWLLDPYIIHSYMWMQCHNNACSHESCLERGLGAIGSSSCTQTDADAGWPVVFCLTQFHTSKSYHIRLQRGNHKVHLRTSLVQLFVLLLQNWAEVVQIIELKRFGGAPHYIQFAPLLSHHKVYWRMLFIWKTPPILSVHVEGLSKYIRISSVQQLDLEFRICVRMLVN